MTSGDIRVGDEFEVRVRVVQVDPDDLPYEYRVLLKNGQHSWQPRAVLLAGRRIERPLQVGDRVRFNPKRVDSWGSHWRGEIVAIRRDKAFVDWEKGICDTRWALADLEPAPASEGGGT